MQDGPFLFVSFQSTPAMSIQATPCSGCPRQAEGRPCALETGVEQMVCFDTPVSSTGRTDERTGARLSNLYDNRYGSSLEDAVTEHLMKGEVFCYGCGEPCKVHLDFKSAVIKGTYQAPTRRSTREEAAERQRRKEAEREFDPLNPFGAPGIGAAEHDPFVSDFIGGLGSGGLGSGDDLFDGDDDIIF